MATDLTYPILILLFGGLAFIGIHAWTEHQRNNAALAISLKQKRAPDIYSQINEKGEMEYKIIGGDRNDSSQSTTISTREEVEEDKKKKRPSTLGERRVG